MWKLSMYYDFSKYFSSLSHWIWLQLFEWYSIPRGYDRYILFNKHWLSSRMSTVLSIKNWMRKWDIVCPLWIFSLMKKDINLMFAQIFFIFPPFFKNIRTSEKLLFAIHATHSMVFCYSRYTDPATYKGV